ncbi:MAG: PAS domain-containing sensor histidine kinase [Sulfuritalea sp.]|jgi:signal transduction histidine kinase|nr:PAS domain-containing sensor histidine kinase [Sulfuritalea sp.]
MKHGAVSLLHRLLLRWPLLLALAFTVYSAALLTYAFGSWQRMRQDANSYLVADNQRRALALTDLAGDIRTMAGAHADIHEIRAYLSNRDLGMSPRYGLNAGLAAIEARFEQLAEQAGHRWAIAAPRITYHAADGSMLADSAPGTPGAYSAPPLAAKTRLTIMPEQGVIVVAAPVMHKGRPDGTVVTAIPVAAVLRKLLVTGPTYAYRELLLTTDGNLLRMDDRSVKLDLKQRRMLAGLRDDTVLPAVETLGPPFDDGTADDVLLVKTSVSGLPLVLVTFVSEKLAYGHLVSRRLLLAASLLLVVLLLGALKLERMRLRAAQLEANIASAERDRALTEFRNVELSAEIARREAAEARTSDRNEQLNAIFDLSPDGFVSFDQTHRVKYANPAFLAMTGYGEADILGLDESVFSARLARDCVTGDRFAGVGAMRRIKEAETGGDAAPPPPRPRLLIELAGKHKRVLELKLRLSGAATVSEILYLRDVTHEVEVERVKSEFLAHAAHELRTPMAGIYGFSELLLTQEFDDETRKDLLATIHSQTEWLVAIINELLDLARIEARRGTDLRLEAVPLAPLVREVVASLHVDPARWPVDMACPVDLPPVRADAGKLRQALTNVLGNATKYSPEGGAVEIHCAARGGEGNRFIGIAVTDHGIGMRPDQAARVCERFYRADTSGRIPGTGLGMAIVKEIVELLDGHVEIVSKVGAGTTVTLWLPAGTRESGRNTK